MTVAGVLLAVTALLLSLALPITAQSPCGFGSFNFTSLSTYDLFGTDGSAGSNEDSYYVVRLCGAVSDVACAAQPGGSMVCQHSFPFYNQVPNGGTIAPPSSPTCSQDLTNLIAGYSTSAVNTTWSYVNSTIGASSGALMSVTSGTACGGAPITVNVQFLCAPLQTNASVFSTVASPGVPPYTPSTTGCTLTFTLYTSLACLPANLTSPPTAIAPPPAATAANCGYQGISFTSLAVDMTATDEGGRTYVVHPCGAVSSVNTQFCSYPSNGQQQPNLYPSACEVSGYCNPFYATDSFGYFSPSIGTWYALTNGFAYQQTTPLNDEGWTSVSNGCASSTTYTFICNASATTVAATAASIRIFSDASQCQYIIQLQTSLACTGSAYFLPSPTQPAKFGGLGYDLSPLTGYDIFAAQTGVYVGSFSTISFCTSIFNGNTTWSYSLRGVLAVSYSITSGTLQNPTGQYIALGLLSGSVSFADGSPDVQLFLSPLGTDGSDNVLSVTAGSNRALPDGGGLTFQWTTNSGVFTIANLSVIPSPSPSVPPPCSPSLTLLFFLLCVPVTPAGRMTSSTPPRSGIGWPVPTSS